MGVRSACDLSLDCADDSYSGFFNKATEDAVFSNVIDLLFNCAAFIYIGAIIPFHHFNDLPDVRSHGLPHTRTNWIPAPSMAIGCVSYPRPSSSSSAFYNSVLQIRSRYQDVQRSSFYGMVR